MRKLILLLAAACLLVWTGEASAQCQAAGCQVQSCDGCQAPVATDGCCAKGPIAKAIAAQPLRKVARRVGHRLRSFRERLKCRHRLLFRRCQ